MIGLLHYSTFLPGPAQAALAVLAGPQEGWLGGTPLDGDRVMLAVRPDGLLVEAGATLDVVVGVGPCTHTTMGLLRRLSFAVPDRTPPVRCDLEVGVARVDGCRIRLRGDYRPPLQARGDDVDEVLEALTRPLVEGIVSRVGQVTLPV